MASASTKQPENNSQTHVRKLGKMQISTSFFGSPERRLQMVLTSDPTALRGSCFSVFLSFSEARETLLAAAKDGRLASAFKAKALCEGSKK